MQNSATSVAEVKSLDKMNLMKNLMFAVFVMGISISVLALLRITHHENSLKLNEHHKYVEYNKTNTKTTSARNNCGTRMRKNECATRMRTTNSENECKQHVKHECGK